MMKTVRLIAIFFGFTVVAFVIVMMMMSIPSDTIDALENTYGINNLHLMDSDKEGEFKIYRLGEPDSEGIENLCKLGVTEIAVLSGSAEDVELNYQSQCPSLKVVYNYRQDASEPLSGAFLRNFDGWVENAKKDGKAIALRCNSGSHRTGRLAAYYQMKYRGFSAKEVWDLAQSRGVVMHIVDKYSGIQQQILALEGYIHNRPCTQSAYCVLPQGRAEDQFFY